MPDNLIVPHRAIIAASMQLGTKEYVKKHSDQVTCERSTQQEDAKGRDLRHRTLPPSVE